MLFQASFCSFVLWRCPTKFPNSPKRRLRRQLMGKQVGLPGARSEVTCNWTAWELQKSQSSPYLRKPRWGQCSQELLRALTRLVGKTWSHNLPAVAQGTRGQQDAQRMEELKTLASLMPLCHIKLPPPYIWIPFKRKSRNKTAIFRELKH